MFSLEQRVLLAAVFGACIWVVWQSFRPRHDTDTSGIGGTNLPHEPGSALQNQLGTTGFMPIGDSSGDATDAGNNGT